MGYFYGDSKTDLEQRCHSCTILQLCGGAQVIFLWICGYVLQITAAQHLQNAAALLEHVSGTYCICKHQFLWISATFVYNFCLRICVTVCHWKLSGQHFMLVS